MNKEQVKVMAKDWEQKRKLMPCPIRPEGCEGCRFKVMAVHEKPVDPKIAVVGKPPEPELMVVFECGFDLTAAFLKRIMIQAVR